MKTSIIIILAVLLSGNIGAKKVDKGEAHRAASAFITHSLPQLRGSLEPELIYTATGEKSNGLRSGIYPLFYIFNIPDNRGFVIISGDDTAIPVLAYSDKGSFKTEQMPENLSNRLILYEKEINHIITNNFTPSEYIQQKWNELLTGVSQTKSGGICLSTALWDQTAPYNDLCPLQSGKHTVTGCVATAMGILMKYNEWPVRGSGSNQYKTTTGKLSVSADFNINYDWQNMLDNYQTDYNNKPLWNTTQEKAVSTLVYHAGAAAYTDFGTKSSGAYTPDAIQALINNFGYDKGMYLAYRNLYSNEEWNNLLQKELNENRPLLYGGITGQGEGHQFIIDGYDQDNYYHVNWGWSGYSNGYYLLSALDPFMQGIGGSSNNSGFSKEQDAVIGIKKARRGSVPNHEFYFIENGKFETYGLSVNTDVIRKDEPFILRFSYVVDYGARDFNGLWGIFLTNKNGTIKEELEVFSFDLKGDNAMYTDGDTYIIRTDIEEGDKIRLYYSSDKKTWKAVRGTAGTVTELPVGVGHATSNRQVTGKKRIRVFPAMAQSVIYIRTYEDLPIRSVRFFTLSGNLIKEHFFNSNENDISVFVHDLIPGVYIVSVQTEEKAYSCKIVKR